MLFGAEINILDTKGTLDMTEEQMGRLDLRIAGIHSQCWKGGSKAENTEAVINVMSNPMIDIISHPADGTADLDFEALVRASKRYGTHLEINNHSLHPVRHKTEAVANNLELLRQAKRHDVPVILGSDAHVSFQIADYCFLEALLKEADFPEELILNDKPELILPKHFSGLNKKPSKNHITFSAPFRLRVESWAFFFIRPLHITTECAWKSGLHAHPRLSHLKITVPT